MVDKVKLTKETEDMVNDFKPLFEAVIEKKMEFNSYINTIIQLGVQKILRDSVPAGEEWQTIELLFKKDRKAVCQLLTEVWSNSEKSTNKNMEESKDKIKKAIDKYIG